MTHFRAVTFDVTGTLLQFRLSPPEYYAKVASRHGVLVHPKIIAKNFKTEWLRINSQHPNFGLRSGLGWEQWWRKLVCRTLVTSSDTTHDESTLETIASDLIVSFQTPECWTTHSGVHELLGRLTELKIPLGIVSNNDIRLETVLKVMRLREYFKFVLTSYDAGCEKPDPQIFNLALTMFNLNDLKPSNILHVGDKLDFDYLGAEAAGWNGALVHVEAEKISKKYQNLNSERVFNNLFELKKVFD